MKDKKKSHINRIISMVIITALFLIGVTPSFAETIKPSATISWEDAPLIEGTSAILMDARSGEILYEKNAYEKRDPASITKIMTCLVVLETMDLDEEVVVPYEIPNIGTGLKVKKGEIFTVEQLLYGMMLESANDAAEVLAVAAGGTIENFCELMNERAVRCGAEDTNFTNPNGLNEPLQPEHRTTAYDLALISKEAMKNKTFRKIVGTVDYTIPKTNKSKARAFRNGNRCISDGVSKLPAPAYIKNSGPYTYEGAIGIKTGYTSTAGNCFCGWAQKEDTNLISIVLNTTNYETRFSEVIALWDYGFDKYYTYEVLSSKDPAEEVKVRRGAKGEVKATVKEDLCLTLNNGYKSKGIKTEVESEAKLTAPVKKGEVVGQVLVYKDGDLIVKEDLLAMEDVDRGGPLSYLGIPDEDVPMFLICVFAVLILVYIIIRLYKKNKYRKKREKRARLNRNIRRREWDKEKNPFD